MKKSELKPGKKYTAKSPKGHEIIGTDELLPGCAYVKHLSVDAEGVVEQEWVGETKIYYDGAMTQKNNKGETLYVCKNGDTWPESELVFEEIK
jgi:hypothetical protein